VDLRAQNHYGGVFELIYL